MAALVKKATDARGGLDKLKAIKTISADSDTTLATPEGTMIAKTRTFIEYPERMRVEADLPNNLQTIQVYANGAGWLKDPAGVHDVPPEMLTGFRASTRRDSLSLLIGAATGAMKARLLPDEGVKGKTMKVLEVSAEGLAPIKLYIDPDTGLIAKMIYDRQVDDPRAKGQGPAITEEVYDDYREVEGIKFAYKASVTSGGQAIIERSLTALRINPPFAPDLFAKPK